MNKKHLMMLFTAALFLFTSLSAQVIGQDSKPVKETFAQPEFTLLNQVPITSVKSQGGTGTCWCFATTSMIESEIIRLGKAEVGISEMFTVRHAYADRGDQYIRFHGTSNFAQGGAQHDVTNAIAQYGLVPREVYEGLNYGTKAHSHGEIESVLKGTLGGVMKNRNGTLSTVWKTGFNNILDAYFGELPGTFKYEGKSYTAESFAKEMGINADDYVEFSSYTHHPFYEEFVLEVPDNWAMQAMYNVPIDELMEIMHNAIDNNISISWAADITGLNYSAGVALIPAAGENSKNLLAEEKQISQEDRQYMYDGFQLTDDHAMHIVGKAKDQNGKVYFIEKNSWGVGGKYEGFSYLSESFLRMRTMSIMVHKDAVPERIAKKVGLNK